MQFLRLLYLAKNKCVTHQVVLPALRQIHSSSIRISQRTTTEQEDDSDKPIQYTTSKAAEWRARQTFSGGADTTDSPWYERFVVVGSVAVFLIYFCILREENDIDEEIDKPLWARFPVLEEKHLQKTIKERKDVGLDTSEQERRLREVRKMLAQ